MTIEDLAERVDALMNSILQMQKNLTPTTNKVDQTATDLVVADNNIDQNTADIDYIAMMTDVDLPEANQPQI